MRALKEIRRALSSALHLFFPETCPVCGMSLADGEHFICTRCRWEMPLTGYWREEDNPVRAKLGAAYDVSRASAMFFYQKGSGYEDLIYKFKYKGQGSIARELGRWFGYELNESGLYGDVDVIIPVPLHVLRRFKRGYNQAELIAQGLAKELGAEVSIGNLVRSSYNSSQVSRSKWDRWDNVSGIFSVKNPAKFEGKHILIVDDVLTTGATVGSCISTITEAVEDCRISVVTLATSSKDIFGND